MSATTDGFGTVHSFDHQAGSTSDVNFGPGTANPNVAFTSIGADGKICFTNSKHGTVDVVIDQLVTAPS